jgi:lysine 2,3-aminomutase
MIARASAMEILTQDSDREALERVAERYTVRVTDTVAGVIGSADDPVGRQYLPRVEELYDSPGENPDPIGDKSHSPVEGIVHRYPDRVLLMPVASCAVYCRFCFRREAVGEGKKNLSPAALEKAITYIRERPEIREVILTGGDPLILSPRRLGDLVKTLEEIPHIEILRVHSRVPVADPSRITPDLCAALTTKKAMYVAVHVNHAQEITPAAEEAFGMLRRADCVLLSQTVLLRGVNDNEAALENLFRRLIALRVKPYYLHHLDKAPGTAHFRVSLDAGQALVKKLRGRVSGLAQPTYVIDIPGGYGKVPVSTSYVRTVRGQCILTDPEGNEHFYPPAS